MRIPYPVVVSAIAAIVSSAAHVSETSRTGTYTTMAVSRQGTGDIGGTEIFVLRGVDKTFVLVQDAEGAPGYPVLVEASLTESTLEFDLGETILRDMGRFSGRFEGTSLVGTFSGSRQVLRLPRSKSFWQ